MEAETASEVSLDAAWLGAAPRRSAEDLMRQVAGLTLVQHGSEGKGHQFFLRGFDAVHGADFALTLDGIPLNEWSNVHGNGYIDLGFVLPELVRFVEVSKGPFRLEHGAFATAGAAGYRLGVPLAERGWRASYEIGSTGRHRLFAGVSPARGDGRDFVGLELLHDDGYGERRSIDRAGANARVTLTRRGAHTLALLALMGVARFQLPGAVRNDDIATNRVDFDGSYDRANGGTSARALAALDYTWEQRGRRVHALLWGAERWLELQENITGWLVDPIQGDRRRQRQRTSSLGASLAADVTLLPTLTLRTGGGARLEVFEQTEQGIDRAGGARESRRHLRGAQASAHARAGVTWEPLDTLRLDVGLRFDLAHVEAADELANDRGRDTLFAISPRTSLRWRAHDQVTLFAAYGRGFRPPEARAFSSYAPEATGLGETLASATASMTLTDTAELGARWAPIDALRITLTGFGTFIDRESIYDHVSGLSLELNGTRRLGGELVVQSDPCSWLRLEADVTLVDARFVESGNPVPYAPWLVSALRTLVTHPRGVSTGLRLIVVAPRTLPYGARSSTMVTADFTLDYRWRWVRVGFAIENFLHQTIREGEYNFASHWDPETRGSAIPALHTAAGPPMNVRLRVGFVL